MKLNLWSSLLVLLPFVAQAELYDGPNNPRNFNRLAGINVILNYDLLPKEGKLFDQRLGWSESYWPSNHGGISYRWNHPDPQPFKYKLHTKEELLKMNREELGQLSPAELYDIANDDYSYTLTKTALRKYSPRDLWWEGICHGWAQAATHYPEPAPVVVKNNSGISVPFGASDVKALLSMHEAYNYGGEKFGFVGRRCRVNGKVPGEEDSRDRHQVTPSEDLANTPECKDVNAGGFHVVLTNMIGILGKGFVADIDRYNDVWNQPITGYSSRMVGQEALGADDHMRGVARKVRVQTRMTYGEELKFYTPELAASGALNFVSKLPVTGTPHQIFKSKDYEYILELDSRGQIIGGTWITETRPDFLWNYARSKKFKNSPMPLSGLQKIYMPKKL